MPNAFGWIALASLLWASSPSPPEYRAWIAMEHQDSLLKIQAFCWSSQEGTLQYRFEAKKAGDSGRTASFQSGSAHVRGGEEKLLSQLRLRITAQDRYALQLTVYQGGNKVAEDSATYPLECER